MSSLPRAFAIILLAAGIAVLLQSTIMASPGITGRTNKTGGSGCAPCHGGQTATVTISGPSTLQVGEAGTYTITLSGNSKTGPNVAASDGTLGKVTTQFSVSGGELTFSSARNSDTWQFTYTPTSAGTKTLYATGVINGRPGTWNHAADFTLDATTTKTSVETDVPVTFVLDQNYPNPFNPSTTIHYSTAKTTRVVLTVTDATGKLVATLVDAVQPTGSYQATFDGSRFASGIYFYRLQAPIESGQAGDFVATRKMLMLK